MGLKIPSTLQNGKYTIEKELSRGHFDISYLARRHSGDRWILKILDPDLLSTQPKIERERLVNMFLKEAVTLASLKGMPHIVRTEKPFTEGDIVCLPTEYVQGSCLEIRPQPILSEKAALRYIHQIGKALTVIHKQNLVHRDIRPSNIFLRIRDGAAEAVLANFGLAIDCDTELTQIRKKERVDGFSPIELYSRGQKVGPYTDVYSLAATLYQLLTGDMPISAEKLSDAEKNRVDKRPLIDPRLKNPDISVETAKAIMRGMELRPEKRPQSIDNWLSKFKFDNMYSSELPENTINWTKWQAVWGAVAAIVALLVGIPAWLRQPKINSPSENPSGIQNIQEKEVDTN